MHKESVVFDWFETLVTQPDIKSNRVKWRPGAERLLQDIGKVVIVWTADNSGLIENAAKKYIPSLFGLIKDFYGQGKLPPIPRGFKLPPYTNEEIIKVMEQMEREDILQRRVDGLTYRDDRSFFKALRRKRLLNEMVLGLKVPPLVGSHILIDDNLENRHLIKRAGQLKFSLVDPRMRPRDRNPEAWATRVYKRVNKILR